MFPLLQVRTHVAAWRHTATFGLLALALAGLSQSPSHAQSTGTLAGRVFDAETGNPLPGANVRIHGTRIGAATDTDGVYRILGVPIGTYSITASFAGFQPSTESGVAISSGPTTILDFNLGTGSLGSVEVVSERPLIQSDAIGSPRILSGDDLHNLPVRGESRVRATQHGVVSSEGSGSPNLRGGRGEEVAYYVDGVRVSSQDPIGDHSGRDREQYAAVTESAFQRPNATPLSTFSIDVDRASYANVRRMLNAGYLPPPDAVRIEEFINAFDYALASPGASDEHPFIVQTEVAAAPWADGHRLVRIALQGRRLNVEDLPPANLVFLIDVSGSMGSHDKLPLVRQALSLLVQRMRPQDHVALVVYAGAAGLVLEPTSGRDKERILHAIGRLESGGSTAGGAGLALAYATARQHFRDDSANRVILATDGDFNVGPSSDGEMRRLVERQKDTGIFLSVLGFGTGNLQDGKMEQMAQYGNGNYSYIDSIREAERVLVGEMGGTLFAIAKDVKLQVEFNPAEVAAYRLIGYDNRRLPDEAFLDDGVDAGELGAGHTVTALYEIVPAGAAEPESSAVEALRYQVPMQLSPSARSGELLTVRLRYKSSTGPATFANESVPLEVAAIDRGGSIESASEAMRWATAVVEAGLILRQSEHRGGANFDRAIDLARSARGQDENGDRAEFIRLIRTARSLGEVASNRD